MELLLDLGFAQVRDGRYLESMQTCGIAFEEARDLQAVDLVARAAVGFEQAVHMPGLPGAPAVHVVTAAMAMVSEDDLHTWARLQAALARPYPHAGRTGEAFEAVDVALGLARTSNDSDALGAALEAALISSTDPERILVFAAELDELVATSTDPWHELYATASQLRALISLGRIEEAAAVLDRTRLPRFAAGTRCSSSWATPSRWSCCWRRDGLTRPRRQPSGPMPSVQRPTAPSTQASTACRCSHPSRAGPAGRGRAGPRADGRSGGRPGHVATGPAPSMPIWICSTRRGGCSKIIAAGEFALVPPRTVWPACAAFLAEVCVALGDRGRAARLYEDLSEFRGRNLMVGMTICFGPGDRLLGNLAALPAGTTTPRTTSGWRSSGLGAASRRCGRPTRSTTAPGS